MAGAVSPARAWSRLTARSRISRTRAHPATMASSRNSNGALLRGCQFLLPMSGREPPTIRQVVSALEARDQALAVFRIRFVQNLIGPDQTLTRPTVSPSQVCGIYLSAKAAAMQAILRAASNC